VRASEPILVLDRVVKRREAGDSSFELCVDGLRVDPGQFVAVVGNSGCGKSTLLDMLALVLRPTEAEGFQLYDPGKSAYHDVARRWERNAQRKLAKLRRRLVGYVLQTGGLVPFLTAKQNIHLPLQLNGLPGLRGEAAALIDRLGIAGRVHDKPGKLSGGERQRVAIARAMVHRPAVILADEPTAAVDEARATEIVTAFRQVAKERGAAVVIVSHDRKLIEPLADVTYRFEIERLGDRAVRSRCYRATPN